MTQSLGSIKVKIEKSNYVKNFFTTKPAYHRQNQRRTDKLGQNIYNIYHRQRHIYREIERQSQRCVRKMGKNREQTQKYINSPQIYEKMFRFTYKQRNGH